MSDYVSTIPMGLGEPLLLQNAENRFIGWKSVQMTITPDLSWGALAHLEASGFNRPGHGAVLLGLAASGLPAGTPQSLEVYSRAATQASRTGNAWDADPLATPSQILDQIQARNVAENRISWTPEDLERNPDLKNLFTPEEEPFTLFGAVKGVSRWLILALDAVPEGLDALGRAAVAVKSGQLSVGEAFGGVLGYDQDASQLVGIPLLQYVNAGVRGERLNMGTGWFARGDVSEDIATQLAMWDEETNSMAAYSRAVTRAHELGTPVLVEGMEGQTYRADNYDDWKFLRNNAGRAALLSKLQFSSPEQAGLGQAYGTFNEAVFDEATILRTKGPNGAYFSHSVGRSAAAAALTPNSLPFNVVSGSIDFGKQLVDLPVLGLAKQGGQVINRAKRFIGLGGESGDLIRGSETLQKLVTGADQPAFRAMVGDVQNGALNVDRATQAIARTGDAPLQAASRFASTARGAAPRVVTQRHNAEVARLVAQGVDPATAANMARKPLTEKQTVSLVNKALGGDVNAQAWLRKVMEDVPNARAEDVAAAFDNLAEVSAREGVDLVKGVYGNAQVGDDLIDAARKEAENLARLITPEGKKASVLAGPDGKLMLTYDADLGRAQSTMLQLLGDNPDPGRIKGLTNNLFNNRWITRRWAEKLLGDTDAATAEVDNLVRVLRRNENATDLVHAISDYRPLIDPGRLSSMMTGGGALTDLVDSLVAADSIRKVKAILGPTVELMGKKNIPAPFYAAVVRATNAQDVIDLFVKLGTGTKIIPQRIALLGNYAKTGAATTGIGALIGATAGGIQSAQTGEGVGDVIGGVLSGGVAGAVGGSALGGGFGAIGGGLTRNIDSIADTMDLMLAGTRAATTEILTKAGVSMNRAQAGLGVASQLNYAWGHTPLGRRVARHAGNHMNLADPDDMFQTATDYARNLGLAGDETVTVLTRGAGDLKETRRVLSSQYKTADEIQEAIAEAIADGFSISDELDLNRAFMGIAELTPNNTAAGWVALREFFDTAGHMLAAQGLSDNVVKVLTDFAKEGADEYVGNLGAMGQAVNLAQSVAINGRVISGADGAKMLSEMWSGRVFLPPPEKVHRAVNQLDLAGKITQTFTGRGIWGPNGSAWSELRKVFKNGEEASLVKAFTPELERNVAMTIARNITGTFWVPAVLVTRPMSFLSRVLGEDQFRMAVSGLDSVFTHPINFFSGFLSNWKMMREMGLLRGVAARSLIPDDIWDETGKLLPDALDDMSVWGVAEDVKNALGIYDTKAADMNRVFGSKAWAPIQRGASNYVDAVATEYRQLMSDPIARRLATSKSDDPVAETMDWLFNTDQGKRVAANWRSQFAHTKDAEIYMNPEVVQGFVADEWARLNLKTGGDWVFSHTQDGTKLVIDSAGTVITDPKMLERWGELEDGYTIIRQGDEALLNPIRTGKIEVVGDDGVARSVQLFDPHGNVRVTDRVARKNLLNEERWDAIKTLVRKRHDEFERMARRKGAAASDPRLPAVVKGPRSIPERKADRGWQELLKGWDDGLDRIYDMILGRPTNWFSRQPVLGQYYWERVGLMMPSMTDDVADAFRAIAKKEGQLARVEKISGAIAKTDVAKGIIDDFGALDLGAKAYAVERTKDILFDLTRQRNFIDGMRVVAPFMGPMVEAFEAWGRVIKEDPVRIWRRGGQVIDALWDTNPLRQTPNTDERGMFWVDEDGTEMVSVPFSGQIAGWMQNQFREGWTGRAAQAIPEEGLSMRARGLNVVFGTEDLSDPTQEQFAGFPLASLNPGTGPVFNAPVHLMLKDADGLGRDIYEYLFPFGAATNLTEAMLPYHLRKILEGRLGEASQVEALVSSMTQWEKMVISGQIGEGSQFEFDVSRPGALEDAWAEAEKRGFWASLVEGFARGNLPSLVTPEIKVRIDELKAQGMNVEALVTVDALASEARELFSEEGAQWFQTEDGYEISTEGDMAVVTEYLNHKYGLDMYSAELLNVPLSRPDHPMSFTETGLAWTNKRLDLMEDLENSAAFIMPDYANVENEEFSFRARDAAIARGDIRASDTPQILGEIEGRLLTIRYRAIDIEAEQRFGDSEFLTPEQRADKAVWKYNAKEVAKAEYERGAIPQATSEKVRNELFGWDRVDWDQYNLDPAEAATVRSVLWYLQVRQAALGNAQIGGLTNLSNIGKNEFQKSLADKARADIKAAVDAQLVHAAQNRVDMGNFLYIYHRYLLPELEPEDEFDAVAELARKQGVDLSPYDAPQLGVPNG